MHELSNELFLRPLPPFRRPSFDVTSTLIKCASVFWDLLHERNERDRRGRSGTVTARRKADSLSSARGDRARLVSSGGGSEGRAGLGSDDDGYEGGMNNNYRTRPQQQQQLQQRSVSRDMMTGGRSKGSRLGEHGSEERPTQ